jgi:predicted aspartyl protease
MTAALSRRIHKSRTRSRWAVALAFTLATAPSALAACKIFKIADLPVSLERNRPLIDGQVNGRSIKILIDTGSFLTFIRADAAEKLGLNLDAIPNYTVYGAGGETRVRGTVIREIKFGPFSDKNMRLAVLGAQQHPRDSGAMLVLGQDFFSHFGTEFDLAHGAIRLLRPEGCKPDQLAYWSNQYSLAELTRDDSDSPRIQTDVLLNGKHVDAILDTGATTSYISLAAAREAGIDPGIDSTKPDGTTTGLAGNPISVWTGTFGTFTVGDETVRNVKLRIADMFGADTEVSTGSRIRKQIEGLPEMLIGADFFRSHHILVLFKERKLVFTYNGGPIFQFVETDAAAQLRAVDR